MDLRIPNFAHEFLASENSVWNLDKVARELVVNAPPFSDIFVDPGESENVSSQSRHNAATLMAPAPAGDFQFIATVQVAFGATFDAGVLLVRIDERTWAKLCFEYSPDREPLVVSVVNNGSVSDDANAFVVNQDHISLRISRKGRVWAFHASTDGAKWTFVRAFALDNDADPQIGFEAQSPNASTCKVTFSDFSITPTTITDLRDGQ